MIAWEKSVLLRKAFSTGTAIAPLFKIIRSISFHESAGSNPVTSPNENNPNLIQLE